MSLNGLVSFGLLIALVVSGCGRGNPNGEIEGPELPTEPSPDQESFNVELYESNSGVVRYRIQAAYMATFESNDSTYVLLTGGDLANRQVLAELFDEETGTSTTINAGEIKYFESDHRFEARDSVEVETSEGRFLSTEFLIWQEDARRVRAPGFVRIRSDSEDIQGYGFDSDEQLDRFTLKRVTGQYFLEDS